MAVKRTRKAAASKAATEVIQKTEVKVKAAPARTSAAENTYVVIDHPTEGETVSGLHYAIRMGASEGGTVEISFDNGEWQPTRNAAGYWWYDWGYFTPGAHKIVARLVDDKGKLVKKSAVRKVQII